MLVKFMELVGPPAGTETMHQALDQPERLIRKLICISEILIQYMRFNNWERFSRGSAPVIVLSRCPEMA